VLSAIAIIGIRDGLALSRTPRQAFDTVWAASEQLGLPQVDSVVAVRLTPLDLGAIGSRVWTVVLTGFVEASVLIRQTSRQGGAM